MICKHLGPLGHPCFGFHKAYFCKKLPKELRHVDGDPQRWVRWPEKFCPYCEDREAE